MTENSDVSFNEIEGINIPSEEETLNNEPEIIPNPWDDAPSDVYFYEKMYPDGHLRNNSLILTTRQLSMQKVR